MDRIDAGAAGRDYSGQSLAAAAAAVVAAGPEDYPSGCNQSVPS